MKKAVKVYDGWDVPRSVIFDPMKRTRRVEIDGQFLFGTRTAPRNKSKKRGLDHSMRK